VDPASYDGTYAKNKTDIYAPKEYKREQVAIDTTVETDEFKGTTATKSPHILLKANSDKHEHMLRSFFFMSGNETHQLYLTVTYKNDWRFYRAAYMKGGVQLDFQSIDRDVLYCYGGCTYTESMTAALTSAQLYKAAESGLVIQFSSKVQGGNSVVSLSPAYVQGYLQAIAHLLKSPQQLPETTEI
ncbi:MAG: hypothetical protein ACSHWQ_02535, partial [Spongiibacteraceae bacterium]